MPDTDDLGHDIRALRVSRKMTLEALATAIGKSVGWLSQIERNHTSPSIKSLQDIARALDVPMSLFFGTTDAPDDERGVIVRAAARREIGSHDNGLVETLVSPDLTDDYEVVHSIFKPHSKLTKAIQRPTVEVAYVILGTLDLWIEDQKFTISSGDAFRIRGESYRWANPYDDQAVAVWVISPPVY